MYTALGLFLIYVVIIEFYMAQTGTIPDFLKEFCNSLTLKILVLSIIAILGSYPVLIKQQYYLWLGFAYLYTLIICNKVEGFVDHEADLKNTHKKRDENNEKISSIQTSNGTQNFLSTGRPHGRAMGETGGNIPKSEKLDLNDLNQVHKSLRPLV